MVGFFLLPLALVLIFSGGGGGGGGEGRGSASSLERFVQCTYLNGIRMYLRADASVNSKVKNSCFPQKFAFSSKRYLTTLDLLHKLFSPILSF